MVKSSAYTADMTEGAPIRHILLFAIPLFIGTVFQQFYNFADTMIAGRNLGDQAIAAIGASSAIYSLMIAFANGLNSGYGLVLSRSFGAKDYRQFKRAAASMIILDIAVTVLLTLAALLFLRPLLTLLDTPADIYESAYAYIAIILGGMITTILYNMCAGFLRAVGNSRTPLYFLILSCAVNLVLDILLIVVFHMGVAGTATATVIAEGISAAGCFLYMWKNYSDFLPGREDFRPERTLYTEMFSTGLSMALMLSVFSLGSIIMQRSINRLGTEIITAHTSSRRIYEMLMMPLSTVATANATFVSQNFGAGKRERIQSAMRQVILLELAWSVFSVAVSLVGGRMLLVLLTGTENEGIINNALWNLRLSTVFFFPLGILLVLRTTLQSMKRKIIPVVSSSIELAMKILACVFLIPVAGYGGVVVTEPAIWVICAVFLGVVYMAGKKKKCSVQKCERSVPNDGTGEIRCGAGV